MSDIHQKFTGDVSELLKALDQMQRKHIQLEEQMAKMAKQSKESADKTVGGLERTAEGIGRAVTGAIAGFTSMSTILGGLSKVMDEVTQKAERARQANLSVADAQAAVILNLGRVSDANASAFLGNVAGIATKTNFGNQAPLLTAASSILSAVGGDQQKTLGILETAAPFFRHAPGDLATFGGVLGDVMKSSGMQDPNQALAFALSVQGQSRFEQLGGFKNVSPVLAGAAIGAPQADRSLVARQAAAMFAGIGGELGDPEGGVTKTAVLKLIENLSTATGGQGDLFQQLAAVQANPKLRDSKDWKEFEGQAKLLMGALTSDPNSQVMKSIMGAYGSISADPANVAAIRSQLTGLTPELRVKGIEAESAASIEAVQLDERQALQAQLRRQWLMAKAEFSPRAFDNMPIIGGNATFDRLAMNYGPGMAADFAITDLQRVRAEFSSRQHWGQGNYEAQIAGVDAQIKLLQEIADRLKAIDGSTAKAANKPAGQPGGNEPD